MYCHICGGIDCEFEKAREEAKKNNDEDKVIELANEETELLLKGKR